MTASSRRPTTSRSGRERSGATSTTWSGCRTATSRCSTTVLDRPNTNLPVVNDESSILILKLSGKGKNRKASLVKRYNYEPDPEVAALTQGSARPLENGNWFAGWGQVSPDDRVRPGRRDRLGCDLPVDSVRPNSYRSFKAPWTGNPQDRPAIASEADGGGAKVYASWNGSTDGPGWKVYTGARRRQPDRGRPARTGRDSRRDPDPGSRSRLPGGRP